MSAAIGSALKRVRIEPFIFLFTFSLTLQGITITQLAQDKICRGHFHKTEQYCAKLSDDLATDSVANELKIQILSEVTEFNSFRAMITALPIVFWSLFLGAWADRHPSARRILMATATFASVCESFILALNAINFEADVWFMLLSFIPFSMVGGTMSFSMAVLSYISSTSKPDEKTIRFAIIEALVFIASPLGIFLGGQLISMQVIGDSGQLHNYVNVFGLAFITQTLAFIWILIVPLEKPITTHTETTEKVMCSAETTEQNETQPLLQRKSVLQIPDEFVIKVETQKEKYLESFSVRYMFSDLLDIQNVKDMFNTCTKYRLDNKRSQIWTLFFSLLFISLTNDGSNIVLFQFVQKLFQWNAKEYSIVNSLGLVFTSICVAVIVPFLVKVLKVNDITLSIMGTISCYAQFAIRGTVLKVSAFYLSYVFGCLSFVPAISVRSKLSKIVEPNEVNKVFGLLSTLETFSPLFASIVYSNLFKATISSYTGFVFQFSCIILLVPLCGFLSIRLMEKNK